MNDMKIKYPNGQMTIHLDKFFPTSQAKLNKLLKVIALDTDHKEEHIQTLKQFFQEQVEKLEIRKNESKTKAAEYVQKVADQERLVTSKKRPNGVPLKKEELEQAKEDLKHLKAVKTSQISTFNRCCKQKEQFLKHLEILQKRK